MDRLDDTIAAIASAPGGALRGILRVSGPEAVACVGRASDARDRRLLSSVAEPSVVAGSLRLPGVAPLPCDFYAWPTTQSYTGQPMVEIHTFGCPPLLEEALALLCRAGARLAEPGEFTLRAFLTGRVDLTQAEAVLGVIDAANPRQFDVALAQLAGGIARPLGRLRDELIDLLAHLEAGFDFADEDLPFLTREQLQRQLAAAAQAVDRLARQIESRRETAEGIRAVLVGWPNAGKSSLFNALLGGTGALVSRHPGTTRDYLTAEIDLDGLACLLVDTAGVETDPSDAVRRAAQNASRDQSRAAHVEILCLDSTRPLNGWEREQLADEPTSRVRVLTKTDSPRRVEPVERALPTSVVTGKGIDDLRDRLRQVALEAGQGGAGVVAGTAARCRESLRRSAESLARALALAAGREGEELVAVEIRLALDELGKVVGAVYTDDVLDRVFRRFCIGK